MNPESMERAKSEPAKQSVEGDGVVARIIADGGDGEASYAMFEVRDISPNGAFLAGTLFLELSEEFTIELSLGDTSLRTRVRVTALEQGEVPGMVVVFSALSDSHRALLEERAGARSGD